VFGVVGIWKGRRGAMKGIKAFECFDGSGEWVGGPCLYSVVVHYLNLGVVTG